MRLSSAYISLGLLPTTFVLAFHGPSLRDIATQIDTETSQASFILPCPNCLPSHSPDLDLSLDFGITPGLNPCASNLTLNSVPLESVNQWDFEPRFIQGSSTVDVSGNEVVISWFTACNSSSNEDFGAQLLTVNVHSINGKPVDDSSVAGFTLTFKDTEPPQLLRYSLQPISPSELDPILYIPVVDTQPSSDSNIYPSIFEDDPVLKDQLDELRLLRVELRELQQAIEHKKQLVHNRLGELLHEQVDECEGAFCKFKALFNHLHSSLHVYFLKVGGHSSVESLLHRVANSYLPHGQHPTMISSIDEKKKVQKSDKSGDLPTEPEQCHCRDSPPHAPPPPYEEGGTHNRKFKDTVTPSTLTLLLRFFFVITGLALLVALIRRCYNSPRRRRDRAARREQRQREKEFRCASRRQAFVDWIRGRRRGTPGRRVGDLEEKSRLVSPQEAMLEEHMQDEIRQLKIHEEIAQIRSTRDAVDELIRAEEGRIVYPVYPSSSSSSSNIPPPTYPGLTPLPRPIAIPRPSSNDSDISSPTTDLGPFSPVSRTTSLPSYRSKPPSYREEMSSNDGFSDCDLTGDPFSDVEGEGEGWGSDSSVPDLSPRPSGETVRTFL